MDDDAEEYTTWYMKNKTNCICRRRIYEEEEYMRKKNVYKREVHSYI